MSTMMQTSIRGTVTPVSYAPAIGLTFEEGCGALNTLRAVHNSSPWWIGDLLVFMEEKHGEQWAQATANLLGHEVEVVKSYMYMAKMYPAHQRRENLSISQHREVANLPADQRDAWLDRIERDNLSVREVRALRLEEEGKGRGEEVKIPQSLFALVRKVNPKILEMCSHAQAGDTWVQEATIDGDEMNPGYRVVISVSIVQPV